MLVNPNHVLQSGWVIPPTDLPDNVRSKIVQPNAIDFTIDQLFRPNTGVVTITETEREFARYDKVLPDEFKQWKIAPGEFMDAMSSFKVAVPEGMAATLIIRSSFGRAGLILTSGLYDSGFTGNIGFTLFNRSKNTIITEPGTRIGQIMFTPSVSAGTYNGVYNGGDGSHWGGIALQGNK